MQQACGLEQCANGVCGGDLCETEGVKLIYVVDRDYNLLSFDPGNGNVFSLIGSLSCPAGPSWPGWGGLGPATPFSMSVDRDARAWVLYTSGQIFWVSTADASCQASGFTPGQQGYELFGMGFVADAPGADTEKLFVAGGSASSQTSGRLGVVDPTTLQLTDLAAVPAAEYSPELTGTGNAELYGYYPGMSTFIARMNQATAQTEQSWVLPPLDYTVIAWAFAHWGGRFYVFVTTEDVFTGAQTREVYLLDPMTGDASLLLPNIPYVIVGAGVSTCAPVIIE
jgi:hypothetical protein